MRFDFRFFLECIPKLFVAIPVSLRITGISFIIGLLIGLVLAIVREKRIPILAQFGRFYVSFSQGTPVMLQLYLVYYLIPYLLSKLLNCFGIRFRANMISSETLVVLALALNVAGFMSETIRGGYNAIGSGEIEAAYSIGMNGSMVYRRIIIPQILINSIPNFASNLIVILHGSAIAYLVTVMEITGTSRILAHNNWAYFETYSASGIIYWVITALIEILVYWIERKMRIRGYLTT